MPQSPPSPAAPFPVILTVAGLKNSGKTAVAQAIIAGLSQRGLEVGSVKTMSDHLLSLSAEATDTRRHEEAGAAVVVALHAGGTARFERGTPSRRVEDVARLFPSRIRIIVCEGSLEPPDNQLYVVCLRSPLDLAETLETRRIPRSAVLALSGLGAPAAKSGGWPSFDIVDAAQRDALVDIVLARIVGAGTSPR